MSPSPSVKVNRTNTESELRELCIILSLDNPTKEISGTSEKPGEGTQPLIVYSNPISNNIFVKKFTPIL